MEWRRECTGEFDTQERKERAKLQVDHCRISEAIEFALRVSRASSGRISGCFSDWNWGCGCETSQEGEDEGDEDFGLHVFLVKRVRR